MHRKCPTGARQKTASNQLHVRPLANLVGFGNPNYFSTNLSSFFQPPFPLFDAGTVPVAMYGTTRRATDRVQTSTRVLLEDRPVRDGNPAPGAGQFRRGAVDGHPGPAARFGAIFFL